MADNALALDRGPVDVMNRAAGDERLEALVLPVRLGAGGVMIAVVGEQGQA